MISSMTAFARKNIQGEWGQVTWEMRGVNHRYLDITFKMPDFFREWENPWRSLLSRSLIRGKIECFLTFIPSSDSHLQLPVNHPLLKAVMAQAMDIAHKSSITTTLNPLDLLRWPGVVSTQTIDAALFKNSVEMVLLQTLEQFENVREAEGRALTEILLNKLKQVTAQLLIIQAKLPNSLMIQKEKLLEKLKDVQNIDPNRLEQELVFYAQRIDLAEELERLVIHVQECEKVLHNQKGVGRRLDFLMQEMNREANTLAAKASDASINQASIELKVLIEQMREQIQNVE